MENSEKEVSILIVEDDKYISNFICMSLKQKGYHYLKADTGREAIGLSYANNPDVVILDLGLPDMDGMEVIEHIRSNSDKPIIVVSARQEEGRHKTYGGRLQNPSSYDEVSNQSQEACSQENTGRYPYNSYYRRVPVKIFRDSCAHTAYHFIGSGFAQASSGLASAVAVSAVITAVSVKTAAAIITAVPIAAVLPVVTLLIRAVIIIGIKISIAAILIRVLVLSLVHIFIIIVFVHNFLQVPPFKSAAAFLYYRSSFRICKVNFYLSHGTG